MSSTLPPGFIAFHSNRLESLTDIMLTFMQREALSPLEEDIILVQSNGMAEWVKMELANKIGVCAAIRVELPSRFLWRTYRQVLGAEEVPQNCPLDKLPMTWLLMLVKFVIFGRSAEGVWIHSNTLTSVVSTR